MLNAFHDRERIIDAAFNCTSQWLAFIYKSKADRFAICRSEREGQRLLTPAVATLEEPIISVFWSDSDELICVSHDGVIMKYYIESDHLYAEICQHLPVNTSLTYCRQLTDNVYYMGDSSGFLRFIGYGIQEQIMLHFGPILKVMCLDSQSKTFVSLGADGNCAIHSFRDKCTFHPDEGHPSYTAMAVGNLPGTDDSVILLADSAKQLHSFKIKEFELELCDTVSYDHIWKDIALTLTMKSVVATSVTGDTVVIGLDNNLLLETEPTAIKNYVEDSFNSLDMETLLKDSLPTQLDSILTDATSRSYKDSKEGLTQKQTEFASDPSRNRLNARNKREAPNRTMVGMLSGRQNGPSLNSTVQANQQQSSQPSAGLQNRPTTGMPPNRHNSSGATSAPAAMPPTRPNAPLAPTRPTANMDLPPPRQNGVMEKARPGKPPSSNPMMSNTMTPGHQKSRFTANTQSSRPPPSRPPPSHNESQSLSRNSNSRPQVSHDGNATLSMAGSKGRPPMPNVIDNRRPPTADVGDIKIQPTGRPVLSGSRPNMTGNSLPTSQGGRGLIGRTAGLPSASNSRPS